MLSPQPTRQPIRRQEGKTAELRKHAEEKEEHSQLTADKLYPKDQYNKEFTAREPSAIYGRKRMIYKDDVLKMEYNDPSFVRPVYTNILTWGNRSQQDCLNIFNNGGLSWKYVKLDEPMNADNILYNYVTSNYYVLDTPYFPRIEKHMVNVTEKTSFFINKWEAMNYLEELRA